MSFRVLVVKLQMARAVGRDCTAQPVEAERRPNCLGITNNVPKHASKTSCKLTIWASAASIVGRATVCERESQLFPKIKASGRRTNGPINGFAFSEHKHWKLCVPDMEMFGLSD